MNRLLSNLQSPKLTSWISSIYQNQTLQKGLFLTGLTLVSWKTIQYTYHSLSYLFTKEADLLSRYGKDSWVLITGGSDGIGKEFAFNFAQRGFNIILVARNQEKLNDVEKEIIAKYPNISVKIIVADFSKVVEEGFCERILDEVRDLDISILFNNVGVVDIELYHLIPIKTIREMVTINCLGQALMTRVFLPKLLSRSNTNVRSAIIDNASLASEYPRPYLQVYSATKAFSNYLSEGLSYEQPNLDILSLKPGVVDTKMATGAKLDFKTCTKEQCVNSTFRYLGKTKRTNGHWKHQFLSWFLNALPEPMLKKRLKTNLYIALQQIREEKARSTEVANKPSGGVVNQEN